MRTFRVLRMLSVTMVAAVLGVGLGGAATVAAPAAGLSAMAAPPAPTNVQASNATYTDKVRVTWTAYAGATYWEVWRAYNDTSAKSKLGSPAAATFDDTSCTPGVQYYYWVKACNPEGCSAFSTPDIGFRRLLPPENVSASDGTYTDNVRVTWSASWGAYYYWVHRGPSTEYYEDSWSVYGGTSFDDTTAELGETYYYWVQAVGALMGSASSFSSYNTGYRRLSPPANLSASDGQYTNLVSLSWNSSPGAQFYRLYRNTVNNPATASYIQYTSYTIANDLPPQQGVHYYYWVTAFGPGESDYSATDTGYRRLSPPAVVDASDGLYPDKISVNWDYVANALDYELWRAESAGGPKSMVADVTVRPWYDNTVTPGLTYYYWTKACDFYHCSEYSSSYDPGYARAPTHTPTPTRTLTRTPTATRTRTATRTPTITLTPTATYTRRPTNTPGPTPTRVPGVERRLFLPLMMK